MTATLTQRLAVSALLVRCEAICASGELSELREFALRRDVATVKAAFDDRVQVGDHDIEYRQTLAVVQTEMEKA